MMRALMSWKASARQIELLETGRGVITGGLLEQSDLSALERGHPELARSFIDPRDQLDGPAPASQTSLTAQRPTEATEKEGDRGGKAEQLTHLLKSIRSKPTFERFLLSASEADMLEAARHGPIVVVNVSSYRCDALVIGQSGIRLLELPRLSREALEDHVQELETLNTLGWLWDAIVCPVLNAPMDFVSCMYLLSGPSPLEPWLGLDELGRCSACSWALDLSTNATHTLRAVGLEQAEEIFVIISRLTQPDNDPIRLEIDAEHHPHLACFLN
ncbi:hypothetical protein B0T10DRAFT_464644 [Thelonectria olida]|uniref:Uncharacterized protein n=1 Tax=Thelonectria olida TaxID=1576542 RepID=A0A9P8VV26_9HYPO|nr:hypothetical protein B0T10DRAFT_464644 [Thelonectria olida]